MNWNKILSVFAIVLMVLGLFLAAFVIVKSIDADGRIEYCYTTWNMSTGPIKGYWTLYGFRPWRNDAKIGDFLTLDEVTTAARAHNCELNKLEPK